MKGHPQAIIWLKRILENELTAINQYFLHARMCKQWGYESLGKKSMKNPLTRCAMPTP